VNESEFKNAGQIPLTPTPVFTPTTVFTPIPSASVMTDVGELSGNRKYFAQDLPKLDILRDQLEGNNDREKLDALKRLIAVRLFFLSLCFSCANCEF
jgi:hypothetical protein